MSLVPEIVNKKNPNAHVLFVTGTPTYSDLKYRHLFMTDRSPNTFDYLLNNAKITEQDYATYCIYPFKCAEEDIVKVKNGKMGKHVTTSEEVILYAHKLKDFLEFHPNVNTLVPMSILSLWTCMNFNSQYYSLEKHRGGRLSTIINGKTYHVLPTFHPNRCNKEYETTYWVVNDLKKIQLNNQLREERAFNITPTYEECLHFISKIETAGFCSVDIEVVNQEVYCIGFSLNAYSDTICIPFLKQGSHYFTEEQETVLWTHIATVLENPSITKIGQNIGFDCSFLALKNKIYSVNLEDTMVAQGILFPTFPKGLDFLTSYYLYEPYYKDEGKQYFKDIGNEESFRLYNAKDAAYTLEIFLLQKERLLSFDNWDTYKRQVSIIPILTYMSVRGMKVDWEAYQRKGQSLKQRASKLEAFFKRLTAKQDMNINSSKQLIQYFYGELGLKPYLNKDTGNMSIDSIALKRIARQGFRAAQVLLAYRELTKLVSTYYEMSFDEDHRLRCSYNPVGTVQGRLSSSKTIFGTGGNLQNQPSSVKRYYCADQDLTMFEVDLSQAENRIVAYVAGDSLMIDAFENKKDVHKLTASLIYGVPIESVTKEQRKQGKRANHGLNYDFGYRSFALMYMMPETEAKFIVDSYHSSYPSIRQWHQRVQAQIRSTRTLVNLKGRKQLLLGRIGDELYKQGYSFIPQSTVADIINGDGLNFIVNYPREKSLKLRLEVLTQVHDSISFQLSLADKPLAFEFLRSLKASLEKPLTINYRSFVIPAEYKVGKNWKQLKDFNLSLENLETL